MTGAECLLRTLLSHSIDTCFMNPGTSEMQFVSALDRVPAMRGILCLQEDVCSGAADGYARITRRPASTLLHLGPGLANALSNFHNARKARSPIVNIVGEHATHHRMYDAPLTADIPAIARPFSNWVRTVADPQQIGVDAAEAIQAALQPPGGIASLIIPADHSWSDGGEPGSPLPPPQRTGVDPVVLDRSAQRLKHDGAHVALLLSGEALLARGVTAAARIAAATGAKVFANRNAGRITRGQGLPFTARIPYFPEPAEEALAGLRTLILVEAEPPVSFFGYPGRLSTLAPPDCEYWRLSTEQQCSVAALEELADRLAPNVEPSLVPQRSMETPGEGPLTLTSLGCVIAALLPDQAIVADEMVSSAAEVEAQLIHAAPHDLLPVTGGSIGQGLPVAVGAAVAAPDRKVVALEADGSAMYTLQSLWTMAREKLNVVVVLFANRRYRILEVEMARTRSGPVGPRAEQMLDLHHPELDWVSLSKGMGVEAAKAETTSQFLDLYKTALQQKGPFLIEALL